MVEHVVEQLLQPWDVVFEQDPEQVLEQEPVQLDEQYDWQLDEQDAVQEVVQAPRQVVPHPDEQC